MSKRWFAICGVSILCCFIIGVIRLFWGNYGTDEYRILVNLQFLFAIPSIAYAIISMTK